VAVKFRDYYETLGVPRTATSDESKRAYRKLARTHHPDLQPTAERTKAAERFFATRAVTYLGFWALSQVLALYIFFVRDGRSYRRLARDEYGLESAWVQSRQWSVP
jgi:hypothetical protein